MDERGQQGIQKSGGGEADADGIDDERSVEVLQDDAAAVPRDTNRLRSNRIARSPSRSGNGYPYGFTR